MGVLAHGIGGIRDLPVPGYLFFWGATAVLGLSFAALTFLWREPLLDRKAAGRAVSDAASRILLSPLLLVVTRALAFALLVIVWLSSAFGTTSSGANLGPTFVYVVFWIGVAIVVAVLGNIWPAINPWQAAADGVGWVARRVGLRETPPLEYPSRLGRWPGAVLLFAYAALELAWVNPANPSTLAAAITIYSGVTWTGALLFGSRRWFANGDGFSVYFDLLGHIAPLARYGRRIVVRPYFTGLARLDIRPGTIALVAVMLGSVLFDGFSRTSIWQNAYYDVQIAHLESPGTADLLGVLMALGGLLAAVCLVGAAYRGAVAGTELITERQGLAGAFISSLVPIAFVYVIAHYFSLLVYQGQVVYRLFSDPAGKGWDLFGTRGFEPNFTLLTPNTIWYVQVVALVIGHVAGLAVAHDRAVGLFGSSKIAAWSQYPMLVLMVCYTVGGMWVLSQS
jgi:hypothetical protein